MATERKRKHRPHDDEYPKQPRPVRVRLQSEESESVDVLRVVMPLARYGLLLHIEDEMVSSAVARQHLIFECINAEWFDNTLPQNRPLVTELARVSRMCHVELVIKPELLTVISNTIDMPHFHEGNWLKLHFGGYGVPVDVYWPEEGSHNPASIGAKQTLEFLRGISRVRPPSLLVALSTFWNE